MSSRLTKTESRSKPFGFCCSVGRFDPLARYDQRSSPYKSSLPAITSVHECPVSKMRVQFHALSRSGRNKGRPIRIKPPETGDQQRSNKIARLMYMNKIDNGSRNTMRWYLEDEIALANDLVWREKQQLRKEKGDKATITAKKKYRSRLKNSMIMKCPRWYQELSLNQMKNLANLEDVMRADYEMMTTSGTQTTLAAIGVTSTLFRLKPDVIKQLYESCDCNTVDFLREVYKILTGNDLFEEEYKKFYDCNERIILSGIALLTLPETIKELHKRLPAITAPKLPPKPKPPTCPTRRKSSCPYKEELFKCPNWIVYRDALQRWEKQRQLLAKMISPFKEYEKYCANNKISLIKQRREELHEKFHKMSSKVDEKIIKSDAEVQHEDDSVLRKDIIEAKNPTTFDVLSSSEDDKQYSYINDAIGGKSEVMEYKVDDAPKSSKEKEKSWLGEKDTHYVTAGVSEGLPNQITYEIAGVAKVTPSNSDESFFAALKLDKPQTVFLKGRENLSRRWQEWLLNIDEEYSQMEEKADELIESMQAIKKLAFPGPVCDSCCPCRQTRKTREKWRQTKTPYLLINNVMQNGEKKYVLGSTVMHSPGPSLTGSPINLLKTGASRDEMRFRNLPPLPVINIPPCACAIQQMTNKDASSSASKDDISWTKDEGLCPGKKYRPYESGAYSCKTYPGNKSCRRNPFINEVMRMRKKKLEKKELKNIKSSAGVLSDIPASPAKELLSTDQYNLEKKIETAEMAVSLTGQLCQCNYKKKISVYNVSGIVLRKSDERTVDETRLEEVDRIIGGVVYFTPPVSPQRSDELIESPYNICIGKRTGKVLKKKRKLCGCKNGRDTDQKKDIEEAGRKLMDGKSPEERWKIALEDAALKEYFTQRKYVPCWTSCKKLNKSLRNSRNPRLMSDVKDNSHRHWSPTNPSPLSRKDALEKEKKQKEKIGNEIFKLSHENRNKQNAISSMQPTYQEAHNEKKQLMRVEKDQESGKSHTNVKNKMFKFKRLNKTISNKRKYQEEDKIIDKTKQYSKENIVEIKYRQNTSHKQITDKAGEEINNRISHQISYDSDKKYTDKDLMAILKAELKAMAAEGYVFAKLPKCYLLPQFRDWIVYRKGVVFSETDKETMKHAVRDTWELMDTTGITHVPIIKAPSLHMTKHQLRQLTYDHFEKMKRMIEKKRAIFQSEARKARVFYARVMWNTMEAGKFSSLSFKRAFFTYMAGKEADGLVYKPWMIFEVRARDPYFCC
ncbi:uncharacterized protein LOC109853788 isoform X3 [Pseudomyrmex gracilis]|uniref:uncharacterized protein LOC109853788 isoform X3 n=1 Tax=Pseudomyrmex gracilis TaxID=219809 RepID=UPI000995CE11|nr:uncharacterized protein LOC109853788 isoform X3 [Pseudomyrmex gracilis]